MSQALIRHTTVTGSLHLELDTQWKDTDVEVVVKPIDSVIPEGSELAQGKPSRLSLADQAQAWQAKMRAKYGTLPDSTPFNSHRQRSVRMIVVDASVAVKWFLPEADSDQALKWLTNDTTLIAPELIRIEVAAAFTKAVRLNYLQPEDAMGLCDAGYDALDAGDISLITLAADLRQAARLSVSLTHPLQDCLYLALAQRFTVPLLSADNKQVKKAQLYGVKTLELN